MGIRAPASLPALSPHSAEPLHPAGSAGEDFAEYFGSTRESLPQVFRLKSIKPRLSFFKCFPIATQATRPWFTRSTARCHAAPLELRSSAGVPGAGDEPSSINPSLRGKHEASFIPAEVKELKTR